MLIRDFVFGISGGIILYLPLFFTNYIVYLPVLEEKFRFWFLLSVLIGGGISICAVWIKNNSAKHAIFRFFIMFVSNFFTLAFNGRIGTILLLDKLLGIQASKATDRASGMTMFFFLACVFCIGIATIIVMAIVSMVKKYCRPGDQDAF